MIEFVYLCDVMNVFTPFSMPFYVMAKPAGASCNLACDYCYYLEKKHLYRGEGSEKVALSMGDDMLERFTRSYIAVSYTHLFSKLYLEYEWTLPDIG